MHYEVVEQHASKNRSIEEGVTYSLCDSAIARALHLSRSRPSHLQSKIEYPDSKSFRIVQPPKINGIASLVVRVERDSHGFEVRTIRAYVYPEGIWHWAELCQFCNGTGKRRDTYTKSEFMCSKCVGYGAKDPDFEPATPRMFFKVGDEVRKKGEPNSRGVVEKVNSDGDLIQVRWGKTGIVATICPAHALEAAS